MPGILVGIDGSAHSRHALEWAVGEAATRRAPLTVLTVNQPVVGFWGSTIPYPGDPGSVSTQITHHAHCPVVVIPDDST